MILKEKQHIIEQTDKIELIPKIESLRANILKIFYTILENSIKVDNNETTALHYFFNTDGTINSIKLNQEIETIEKGYDNGESNLRKFIKNHLQLLLNNMDFNNSYNYNHIIPLNTMKEELNTFIKIDYQTT